MELFNSLVNKKSIYLKAYSINPINWITWSQYDFAYNPEKKTLFISIRYSSCHWCHIMAKESFSNEAVFQYLSSNFIAIKVDKEEYSDIGKKYQLFAQVTGKQGSWPLSIFAVYEKNPFFAGTYSPLENSFGLPEFLSLLIYINNLYRNEIDHVTTIYKQYKDFLTTFYKKADIEVSGNLLDEFKKILDMDAGGFKGVQKFPNIFAMNYLLTFAKDDGNFLKFFEKTANSLCLSGIFNHIEGGYFRYTVDNRWNRPHFQKMLYNDGLNLSFLAKMYALTGDILYFYTAKKTDCNKMEKLETVFKKLLKIRRQMKRFSVFDNKVIFSWDMIALLGLLDFYNASKNDYYVKKVFDIYFSLYGSMILALFEEDSIIYYDMSKSYVDLFDEGISSLFGIFAQVMRKLKNVLKYDQIDLEFFRDFFGCFYKKYPIATPMIGYFLK